MVYEAVLHFLIVSGLKLPLLANILIFLGVTVVVAFIFLVIAVVHYCCWRQPPPPEDPPAFDMNMDYGGSNTVFTAFRQAINAMQWQIMLSPTRHLPQGGGWAVQRGSCHLIRRAGGQGQQSPLWGWTRHKYGLLHVYMVLWRSYAGALFFRLSIHPSQFPSTLWTQLLPCWI